MGRACKALPGAERPGPLTPRPPPPRRCPPSSSCSSTRRLRSPCGTEQASACPWGQVLGGGGGAFLGRQGPSPPRPEVLLRGGACSSHPTLSPRPSVCPSDHCPGPSALSLSVLTGTPASASLRCASGCPRGLSSQPPVLPGTHLPQPSPRVFPPGVLQGPGHTRFLPPLFVSILRPSLVILSH